MNLATAGFPHYDMFLTKAKEDTVTGTGGTLLYQKMPDPDRIRGSQ
jgi:hypothetical protein